QFFIDLAKYHVTARDTQSDNILVRETNGTLELVLIDGAADPSILHAATIFKGVNRLRLM
ncbi:MAG: hypothetical protein GWM87_04855, partial [Xanthomonadales bacterium]|nr:hypothetical protein [Xanthomonadales bacterium]NIX12333.1 hypothetical protein [Xanthomonadales bacterium]